MFKGSIVALVTPFKKGKVDKQNLCDLVEFHIKNKTDAILPCGTTGESPTLSLEEHNEVVDICIEAAKGRVPIMAGTGSNSTSEAIEMTQHAEKAGAKGALVVVPYYNRPTQQGLFLHFKEVANSTKLPIILYNIPGRTGRNMEPETIAQLAKECKNIIGIKEASGSLEQAQIIKSMCPKDFLLFSGDDTLTLPMLSIGGVGVISVVANIIPQDVVALIELFNKGKIAEAQALNYKMLNLSKAMFVESNPAPVKKAMEFLGLCSPEVRLPLSPLEAKNVEAVKIALKNYGLLNNNPKSSVAVAAHK